MTLKKIAILAAVALATQAQAQSTLPTTGTLVIVPAYGEVTHVNDEATVNFMVEEQDKDKAAAASRVNQKMKQSTDIVRKEDSKASLKTMGYYTYPVYPEAQPPVVMNAPEQPVAPPKPPKPIAWRVGQYLEVKTTNIGGLPKMTAAVQKVAALNGINFGLSPATTKQLDDKRIAETYRNLNERIASIAGAMGRKVGDATLETVDFEGSGNYAGNQSSDAAGAPMMMRAKGRMQESAEVAEPSFEPGETTLQMRLVGKVKFK
ncbi:SIMPL domain-containing protein [Massilia sp. CF038]|uniref:SIMPL domain-containing protein n=1 Tax=Massilia sp. CF038 TaxID=1881045 RepID=UPI00092163E0|nr:SIMPL domain-containing protein [Massilia sp. CF038]SHG55241.1 Predicted secreted protein [Massilia sp. CF038]